MDFWEQVKIWGLVAGLSMFGGLVDSIRRYKNGGVDMPIQVWMLKTAGDLVIAAFSGLVTFWIFIHMTGSNEFTGLMCAAIAMAGYLGGKAIDIFSAAWQLTASKSVGGK